VRRPMAEQPAAREGRVGLGGKSERPILPKKPGNAGGGKGPWCKSNARRSKGKEIGVSLTTPECLAASGGMACPSEERKRSWAKA
jgi:hypothetical protein